MNNNFEGFDLRNQNPLLVRLGQSPIVYNNNMVKHLTISVNGRVQGVGFRYHTKKMAEKLGINGTVQNEADGTVRIEAEGTQEQLQNFLDWCLEGPDAANVDDLQQREGQVKNYRSFEIIFFAY